MSKGYWVGHMAVADLERYRNYVAANGAVFAKYGARFLVRGGENEVVEGDMAGRRHVVIEFPSYQAARDCYHSPEYAKAMALRAAPVAEGDLVIVEGYDGSQPND